MKLIGLFVLLFFSLNKTYAGIGGFSMHAILSSRVAGTGTNVALATNGGVASASSEYYNGNFPASGAINGVRSGANWGNGGGWNDNTTGTYPDWIQVTFSSVKTIKEIDVFTAQQSEPSTTEPTLDMTFTDTGIVDFYIEYWNTSTLAWTAVPSTNVTGNNKVWRQFRFSDITTDKIRLTITNTGHGNGDWTRVMELEAWTENTD